MSLAPGVRIGPYQVAGPLGAGGMGEVYRATDTNLKRQVALKALPAALAGDAERLARFQREAEVLAALNHPNIAAIYGLEKSEGLTALVMELVEGDDLSQRIAKGAIPIDEALPIAKQIAEALEAAHEQGIIHRDLKPANIKVRPDGAVKVLDFGLAKALDPPVGSSPSVSQSPTITTPAMTQAGMILGTAAYMAPEQARGKGVDKRADIWAFGAVLFEMLTGTRAFPGEDLTDTLAAVVRAEPNWTLLPAGLPPTLGVYLKRCLQKDPKQRIPDIAAMRLALEGAFETAEPQTTPLAAAAPRSMVARALPWALVATSTLALLGAVALWAPWRSAPVPAPRRLMALVGADASLATARGASAILSPDGTTLAFVAQPAGQAGPARLFIRTLDQLQAAPLAGTEGAEHPFFSPDGQWLAFFAGGSLKKVSVAGGAAVTLCDASLDFGGTWADDDTIVFSAGLGNTTLLRVQASGGTPAAFGTMSPGATRQRWPQALPGGRAVLFTEHDFGTNWDEASLAVAPLSGGAPKVVVRGGYHGRYVPSGPGALQRDEREGGHLIYLHEGTLFAVRFDLTRLETVGQTVPAIEGIAADSAIGGAQLAVSAEGTLAYVPGAATTAGRPIDWLTRDGRSTVLRAAPADWENPRFSPDGQKLAVEISDGTQRDLWVYEWERDTLTQLTFDPSEDRAPVWTPDGRRLAFASDRAKAGILNLYWVNADGSGEVSRLTDSPEDQFPWSWHPDGRFLAFNATRGATDRDAMVLPMEGDATRGWTPGTPTVLLSTPASEGAPMFSPDGRWIAYLSAGAGSVDIYVRPFRGPGGPWRISTSGGLYPRWSTTARELLFLTPGQFQIMAAPYAVVGDSFRAATPQIWSPTRIQRASFTNTAYDLHPDGTRVATSAAAETDSGAQDKVVFVFNFGDYLRTIAPGTR